MDAILFIFKNSILVLCRFSIFCVYFNKHHSMQTMWIMNLHVVFLCRKKHLCAQPWLFFNIHLALSKRTFWLFINIDIEKNKQKRDLHTYRQTAPIIHKYYYIIQLLLALLTLNWSRHIGHCSRCSETALAYILPSLANKQTNKQKNGNTLLSLAR